MALETLKGVTELGGFNVVDLGEAKKLHELSKPDGTLDWDLYDEHRKRFPVAVSHDINTLSFRIQNGPVKEKGVNGCQVDTVIHAAKTILEGLNSNFPCRENASAITKLDEALMWLEKRTKDREKRGVEGLSKQ